MTAFEEPDPWDEIAAKLGDLKEPPPDTVIDVTTLPVEQLYAALNEIVNRLTKLGPGNQALHPTTQEARDLQSLRASLLVEITRRKDKQDG